MTENIAKEEIPATILFVDIINSTGISGVQDTGTYNRMLTEYQSLMFDVVTDHIASYRYATREGASRRGVDVRIGLDFEWDITGDEARIFFYSDNPEYDTRSAFQLALKMKLAWLASDFNYSAFEDKGLLFDLGIGLHAGKVVREVKNWRHRSNDVVPRIDGFAINVGKKVEGFSRGGQVFKVFCSSNVRSTVERGRNFAVKFSGDRQYKFKDSAITIAVFEVVSFLDHEIFAYYPAAYREIMLERVLKMVQTTHLRRDLFWLYLLAMRYWLMAVTRTPDARTYAENIIRMGANVVNFSAQLPEAEQIYLRGFLSSINNMIGLAYTARGLESDDLFAKKIFTGTLTKIDAQNIPARLHLAQNLLASGDYKTATKQCADIMMLDPGNPTARAIMEAAARSAAKTPGGIAA